MIFLNNAGLAFQLVTVAPQKNNLRIFIGHLKEVVYEITNYL